LTPPSCLSCWNNQNVEEEPRKEESQLFCFAPEVLRLAKELLEKAPRSTPLVPCIVGHLRHSDGGDTNPTKKTKQATGPSLLIFNLESNSFQKLVTLSKVHEGPIEASGYKAEMCTSLVASTCLVMGTGKLQSGVGTASEIYGTWKPSYLLRGATTQSAYSMITSS